MNQLVDGQFYDVELDLENESLSSFNFDFMPGSVDVNKEGRMSKEQEKIYCEFGLNSETTTEVAKFDGIIKKGAEISCLLIFDGEKITLHKVSNNIALKYKEKGEPRPFNKINEQKKNNFNSNNTFSTKNSSNNSFSNTSFAPTTSSSSTSSSLKPKRKLEDVSVPQQHVAPSKSKKVSVAPPVKPKTTPQYQKPVSENKKSLDLDQSVDMENLVLDAFNEDVDEEIDEEFEEDIELKDENNMDSIFDQVEEKKEEEIKKFTPRNNISNNFNNNTNNTNTNNNFNNYTPSPKVTPPVNTFNQNIPSPTVNNATGGIPLLVDEDEIDVHSSDLSLSED